MKVKTMVGTLIFLIVLNLGVLGTIVYLNVSERQPPIARFMDPNPQYEPPMGRPFERLENMTPEQEKKLINLVKAFQSETVPIRNEIRSLEGEMFSALLNESEVDSIKARSTLRQIADLRLQMGEHSLESLQEAKSFLTEDQQRVFIRRIMSAGRGPGPGQGPGPHGPNPPMLNRPFQNK